MQKYFYLEDKAVKIASADEIIRDYAPTGTLPTGIGYPYRAIGVVVEKWYGSCWRAVAECEADAEAEALVERWLLNSAMEHCDAPEFYDSREEAEAALAEILSESEQ